MGRIRARLVSGVWVLLLFVAVFGVVLKVPVVWGSGTIYIRVDGSIDPPDAPLSTVDNVTYTFTDNISSDSDGIVVGRSNISIDGSGFTLGGPGFGNGFALSGMNNVTIKRTSIEGFYRGIYLSSCSNIIVSENNVIGNDCGVSLESYAVENEFSHFYSTIHDIIVAFNNISFNRGPGISSATIIPDLGEDYTHSSICNLTFVGNTVTSNGGFGINLDTSATAGFRKSYSQIHDVIFSSNNVSFNGGIGINLQTPVSCSHSESNIHNISFLSNQVLSNRGTGIYLRRSAEWYEPYGHIFDIDFQSNSIAFNGENGIHIESHTEADGPITVDSQIYNASFLNNNVSSNIENGIFLECYTEGDVGNQNAYSSIHDVAFLSNEVSSNGVSGVNLTSDGFCHLGYGTICNITFSNNKVMFSGGDGISLHGHGWGYWNGFGSGYIYNVSFSSNEVWANFGDGVHLHSYGDGYASGSASYAYGVSFSSNVVSSNENNGVYVSASYHYAPLTFDLAASGNVLSANRQKGIWIDGGINSNLTHNSVSYNTHGVFYSGAAENLADYNDIYSNSYGMNVTLGALADATNNYWGDASGPYHESLNVNGTGNPVNGDGVDLEFIPFLTDPVGQINERPVAMLEVDRTTVMINDTVTFDASASMDDGQVDYYLCDFGDGTNSSWVTSPVAMHKYVSHGLYNVSLVVLDNLGVTSLDGSFAYVNVTVLAQPIANFTYSPEFPVADAIVTFNASASHDPDGIIESYHWDFGDSGITTVADPIVTHVYTSIGTYTVNLTVTDNDGFNDSIIEFVIVWEVNSLITVNVNPAEATVHSNVTIDGVITPIKADVNVTIFYRPSGGNWTLLATVSTNSQSQYAFVWSPNLYDTGAFEIQTSWSGDDRVSPARSDTITVIVYDAVYIRPDGTVDPSSAPIERDEGLYTLTGNIYYASIVVERDNIVIDGDGYMIQNNLVWWRDGIVLSGRSNVTVKDTKIIGFDEGIRLESTSANIIYDNDIMDCGSGVYLISSSYNTVSNNNITSGYGVILKSSSSNTVSNNTITGNSYGVYVESSSDITVSGNALTDNYEGIYVLSSSYTIVSDNTMTNNTYGCHLCASHYNSIVGNDITNNHYMGVYTDVYYNTSDNRIYHNNFINNTEYQAFSYFGNQWDDDYPSGGNYWSDYSGVDGFSGPNQDQPGNDGIGDTPYSISNGQDRYPLMNPWNQSTDSTPPTIETPSREPAGDVQPNQLVVVSVNVTHAMSRVENVTLSYTINDGITWIDLPMIHATLNLYEVIIPPQQAGTTVRFRIVAYDNAGNNATLDGTEPYCVYQVIPEFPSFLILPLFMLTTLAAVVVCKRKRFEFS